jgi:hypothetical protein
VTKHCIAIADEALHRLQWFASLPDALSVNVLSGQPFELADLILIQGADAQVANPFAAVDNSTRWAEAFEQKITALYEGLRAGTRGEATAKFSFSPRGVRGYRNLSLERFRSSTK